MSPSARQAVFNSMTPHFVEAGTDIIQQGEQGANEFYVLEKGSCEVWVQSSEPGSKPCKVHSYSGCRCAQLCRIGTLPYALACQPELLLITQGRCQYTQREGCSMYLMRPSASLCGCSVVLLDGSHSSSQMARERLHQVNRRVCCPVALESWRCCTAPPGQQLCEL